MAAIEGGGIGVHQGEGEAVAIGIGRGDGAGDGAVIGGVMDGERRAIIGLGDSDGLGGGAAMAVIDLDLEAGGIATLPALGGGEAVMARAINGYGSAIDAEAAVRIGANQRERKGIVIGICGRDRSLDDAVARGGGIFGGEGRGVVRCFLLKLLRLFRCGSVRPFDRRRRCSGTCGSGWGAHVGRPRRGNVGSPVLGLRSGRLRRVLGRWGIGPGDRDIQRSRCTTGVDGGTVKDRRSDRAGLRRVDGDIRLNTDAADDATQVMNLRITGGALLYIAEATERSVANLDRAGHI